MLQVYTNAREGQHGAHTCAPLGGDTPEGPPKQSGRRHSERSVLRLQRCLGHQNSLLGVCMHRQAGSSHRDGRRPGDYLPAANWQCLSVSYGSYRKSCLASDDIGADSLHGLAFQQSTHWMQSVKCVASSVITCDRFDCQLSSFPKAF